MQSEEYLQAHAAARAPELLLALRQAQKAKATTTPYTW
jgi:hypothetical protein